MLGCLEPRGPRERRALVEKGLETHDKRSASFTRAKPYLVIAAAVFDVALTVPARDPAALLIAKSLLERRVRLYGEQLVRVADRTAGMVNSPPSVWRLGVACPCLPDRRLG
jgi:hypothetical protein